MGRREQFDTSALAEREADIPTSEIFAGRSPTASHPHTRRTRTWGARSPQFVSLEGKTVYARQGFVEPLALSHYLDNGSDNEDRFETDYYDEREDVEGAVLNRYPNMTIQGGDITVEHGHHRTAAALLRGDSHIEARVLNFDQFPEGDSRASRGRIR